MGSRRNPQSLNDSHYRLLQDLTTPRPANPAPSAFNLGSIPPPPSFRLGDEDTVMSREQPEKIKGGGGGRDRDDSAPRFSMLSDSESPLEERNKDKAEVEIKQRLTGVLSLETEETENIPPSESGFSEAIDKPKQVKVKLQGRRRLCKAYDRDGANSDDLQQPCEDPSFDFDSPLPQKNHGGGTENEDTNDIRDILNNLNSRFELLSIEKKRPTLESSHLDGWKSSKAVEIKNKEEDDYTSAGSSFSASPGLPDCSSVKESEALGGSRAHIALKEKYLQIGVQNHRQAFPERIDCDEDDDECVILSGKNQQKKFDHGEGSKRVNNVGTSRTKYDGESVDIKENAPFILTGSRFSYNLPREIAKILYPHQVDGLKWLWSLHCQGKGGILGDDMGLGKTMQICGFLAGLFHSRLIKRALIVAPKTLLSHWMKELSAVGLSEKTREYFGTNVMARQYDLDYVLKHKGLLLTTYDIVRNNSKSLRGYSYYKDDDSEDRITWNYMILDEGHLIKNPSTQRAKSLLEIPSAHRIIISGTPIQNNLRELWALFNFCCPELLGDKKEFKEKYEDRILRGNDKKASDREKRIGSTAAKDLRERIQPYFLRRLKSEVFLENDDSVAKLSKKNELIVWLRLTSCQRQLYEAYLNSELVLSSFYDSPLAALTILKKICDHPLILTKRAAEDVLEGMDSMTNPEDVQMAEKLASYIADVGEKDGFLEKNNSVSCKISFIMTLLDKLIPDGHNVLIFSQTRKMLNLIQESLVSSGYAYLRIDGTTKADDRIKIVNDFQEGAGAPIFLLTSQVGGLGLTLTKADRVIVVDPAWNPSTDNQSVDRAYRIGQTKDVVVYRLMTCGTVEEKIYRKQIYKGGLFKTATEHKEQMRYFSQQDLRELFSLPKEGFDISVTQKQLQEEHDRQHQMNESLKSHIEFLMTLGIAGVSNHSLLYSKTAPVQDTVEEVEEIRPKRQSYMQYYPSSRAPVERDVDGAAFAFNPKDVKLVASRKSESPVSAGKKTESEIKERMNRISQMLGNQVMISRLPDKGEKLKKQMIELNLELQKLREEADAEKEVIDLDEISGNFQKQLNVVS